MRLKLISAIAIQAAIGLAACSNRPDEGKAKPILEYLMGLDKNPEIVITKFTKTNGQPGEVFGQKTYLLAYEAELEVVAEPKKVHVPATHGMFPGSGEPAHDQILPTEETLWSKLFPIRADLVKM